jgi:hypothetical protein
MEKLNVVQSNTEPKTMKVLWLSPEGLKEPTNSGWKLVNNNNNNYSNDFSKDFKI